MRIAIIGTRGIPNKHGGYEQFAEFAAPELVKRGHVVYVYNSSLHGYLGKTWEGVYIKTKKDWEDKIGTAGQFIYDLNCILDARRRNFDVILQLGYTSSSIWSFLFPKKAKVITNMDGLEWKRSKYSKVVQKYLMRAERWAALYSDYLISDSKGIQQYILEKYRRTSFFIAYGANLVTKFNDHILEAENLEKYRYNVIIARMEPENNIETIIKGHLSSKFQIPLIIIGSFKNKFGNYLKEKYESSLIQFWGAIYDIDLLNNLRHYCNLYFHGHSVGGTNPSLLEAMASQSLIASHDNIFNRNVLGNDALYFKSAVDVSKLLELNIERGHYHFMINNNTEKIIHEYSWNHIINLLENCLNYVVKNEATVKS